MEIKNKLEKKYNTATKALKTLEFIVTRIEKKPSSNYDEARDSLIKRFEYSTDAFWKLIKKYIETEFPPKELINSPQKTFRHALEIQILLPSEFELCRDMQEGRNLTTHTYNEDLADIMVEKIPAYCKLMITVVNRIGNQLENLKE